MFQICPFLPFCNSSHIRAVALGSLKKINEKLVDQLKLPCKHPAESLLEQSDVGPIRRTHSARDARAYHFPSFYATSSFLATLTAPQTWPPPVNKLQVLTKTRIFSAIIFSSWFFRVFSVELPIKLNPCIHAVNNPLSRSLHIIP